MKRPWLEHILARITDRRRDLLHLHPTAAGALEMTLGNADHGIVGQLAGVMAGRRGIGRERGSLEYYLLQRCS